MRVAICDDDRESRARLRSLIKQQEPDCEVACFDTGKRLLEARQHFDILLLDIQMEDMSGIEVARVLRINRERTIVIFVTALKEYAAEAFEVEAFNYLLKPLESGAVCEMLDFVIAHLLTKKDKIFGINTKKGCVNVNYSEIVHVENVARRMWVTLKNGKSFQSVGIRDSFEKQVGCLLQEENFIQPHKSYVVNLDYVSSYTTTMLHMENNSDIPISRRNSLEVKKRYLKYLTLR